MSEAQVTYRGFLDSQVCVPAEWTDEQVLSFANDRNPCGTRNGWHIRREGDEALGGDPERVQCAERAGYVHIMVDA